MSNFVTKDTLRTIREELDEYLLEDGNTLRFKDVLISLETTGGTKKDESGKVLVEVSAQFHTVSGIINTGNVDVSHLEESEAGTVGDDGRVSKIGFKSKRIILNLYETDEQLIIVRTELREVWTTKFKDKEGRPIYRFSHRTALESIAKESLEFPKKQ